MILLKIRQPSPTIIVKEVREPISFRTLERVLIGFRQKSLYFDDPIAEGAMGEEKEKVFLEKMQNYLKRSK